jgi:hypothetical protein
MTSRYRCFHCQEVVEEGEEHRHPAPATSVPRSIDELLRDPSPGLSGSFKIDLSGHPRHHVAEMLAENLAHRYGRGELEYEFDVMRPYVVNWRWVQKGDNDG